MIRYALLAIACGTLASSVAELSGQEAADWVEGYFELSVEGIPARPTIVTLVEEERVLVPLQPVLLLTEVPVHYDGATRVLEWPPDVWRTEIDPITRTLRVGADTVRVSEEAWVERDGDFHFETSLLARLLDAEILVDMSALTISIVNGPDFPAVRRAETAARRRIEQAQAQLLDPRRYEGVPYPARTGGFAAGWSVSMTEAGGMTSGVARPTLGAGVLGGSLDLGFTSFFADHSPARTDDVLARYQRIFPGNDRVRQVSLGTILSSGVLARPLIGASVSNEPWVTPQYFDQALITPAVPAGWDFEVYQGNRLVGVSTTQAPAEITAPIAYGSTPVRVRMIGPAGQERIEELVYVVPSTQVPDRQTRYSIGGGACDEPSCDAYGFAEVGRGLTRKLTAYLGADYLARPDDRQLQPYARVGYAIGPSLHVGAQARGSSFLRADVQHYRGPGASLRASYAYTRPDGTALGPPGWIGQLSGSAATSLLGGRWLHARLWLRGLTADRVDGWQSAVSTNLGLTTLEAGAEWFSGRPAIVTARAQQAVVRGVPTPLRSVAFGAGLGVGADGIDLVEVGATGQMARRGLIDLRFRARSGFDPTLVLGVTLASPFGFFRGRGTATRRSSYFVGADGGAVYDPSTGLMPFLYQSVGQSGVTGEVFYDLNGDRQRGPDEPLASGVTVDVGGWRSTTDADGRFVTWELVPYEGISVRVDSLSIDPGWAVDEQDLLLRPTPNLLTRVSIPLHPTREVIGSVLFAAPAPGAVPAAADAAEPPSAVAAEGRPVAGAGVEIVDAESGDVVFTERTFSDGVFYVSQLRAGRYVLRLSAPTGGALGLSTSPEIPFEIPAEGGPPIELPPLLLLSGN